jgi:hypothetical protein
MPAHLFGLKKTAFDLWRPHDTTSAPKLVIGQFQAGNPPTLGDRREFDLVQVPGQAELWSISTGACGLTDGQVYDYWFEVTDSNPDPVEGNAGNFVPARQLMKAYLLRWMSDFAIDGIRMDSVNNVANWDFVQEYKDLARDTWLNRGGTGDKFLVVANFSDFVTANASSPSAEYRVPNWPATPAGKKWREITQQRDVPAAWVGREPIFPWEAKVYALIDA